MFVKSIHKKKKNYLPTQDQNDFIFFSPVRIILCLFYVIHLCETTTIVKIT